MPIKLPRLTWGLDCEPIAPEYTGIVLTFWLNPPMETSEEAEKVSESKQGRKPWETPFLRTLSLVLDSVRIPAGCTTDGQALTVEIPDEKALYDLQHDQGFDPQILLWASTQYQTKRIDRLREATKN